MPAQGRAFAIIEILFVNNIQYISYDMIIVMDGCTILSCLELKLLLDHRLQVDAYFMWQLQNWTF